MTPDPTSFSRRIAELIADAVQSAIEQARIEQAQAREREMLESVLLLIGLINADLWRDPALAENVPEQSMTSNVGTQG